MTDRSPAEEAQDPSTSAHRLAELAASHPETQVSIASHPNVYDDLLEWLHTYGTAEAKDAVDQSKDQTPAEDQKPDEDQAPVEDQNKVLAGVGASDTPASVPEFFVPKAKTPASGPPASDTPVVAVPASSSVNPVSDKKYMTAVFLMLFLGGYGADRFYLGRVGTGVLKLITLGFGGLWTMTDGLRIANGSLRGTDELELDGFREHHRVVQIIVWILAGIYFLSIGLAIAFFIWVFAQASTVPYGASEYSSSSDSDGSGTGGSTTIEDGTESEPDDYYSDDDGYEDDSDSQEADSTQAQDSPEDSSDTADNVDVDDADQLLLDAAGYCPSGYGPQAYGETQSAFFVICTDGFDLVYYGESYRLGTGITLPAYESGDGYEATNFDDGVTTLYSASEYSLTITNQNTGTVALDETVFSWAEDKNAGY